MAEMKSFKIGDSAKIGEVKQAGKTAPKGTPPPAPSVGFPNIEALVEAEHASLDGFVERMAKLQELAKSAASNKEKAAAKKAAIAYEKAKDLIEYLLETKQRLQQGK